MIPPLSKKKEKSLPTLIHDLDGVFSRYIRLRDMVNGRIPCFICGRKMTFQEAQCMHFIDRDQMATRYDEMNCHAGCEECNCFDPDHHDTYALRMTDKYGVVFVGEIIIRSKSLQKFMRHEIEDLISHYTEENRVLKAQKMK